MKKSTMKMFKLIGVLFAFMAFASYSYAQMPNAITIEPAHATAYDTVKLWLNTNHTCPVGALDTATNIHIHSGVKIGDATWQNVVDFDAEGANGQSAALTQENDSMWYIEYVPADFYGLDPNLFVTQINGVFNNGTWDAEGKDFDADSACVDFFIPLNVNPVSMDPPVATAWDTVTLTLNTAYTCPAGALDTVTNIHIHSGVTIGEDMWQNVVEFDGEGANGQSTALTKVDGSDSLWTITYVPADFYGIDEGAEVSMINCVFNNGSWDAEGKMFGADSTCADINVNLQSNVGFADHSFASEFNIYPNPVNDVLYVDQLENVERIEVYNMVGQQVKTVKQIRTNNVSINTSGLKSGVYFISFVNEAGQASTTKFIKE